MAEPALRCQCEFEPGMLSTGDADIGRGQQDVEPGPRRPAIDRGNDRLPYPRVVVAHPPIDAGLLAMHGAGERPEDTLGSKVFAFLLGDVRARCQIVPAAEMSVTGPGQDRAADVAVFPEISPGLRNRVRCRFVEDVCLIGIIERDVSDAVALFVIDGQLDLLWQLSPNPVTATRARAQASRIEHPDRCIWQVTQHARGRYGRTASAIAGRRRRSSTGWRRWSASECLASRSATRTKHGGIGRQACGATPELRAGGRQIDAQPARMLTRSFAAGRA
jgi:hypothetical protein